MISLGVNELKEALHRPKLTMVHWHNQFSLLTLLKLTLWWSVWILHRVQKYFYYYHYSFTDKILLIVWKINDDPNQINVNIIPVFQIEISIVKIEIRQSYHHNGNSHMINSTYWMTLYVCYLLLTHQVPVLYVYVHGLKLVITVPADA